MQVGLEEQVAPLQGRIPVFTRSVKGAFRRFKSSVLITAYAVFFLLPWLPWQRADAPDQAVLFDVPGRRFLIFDLTMYPQDVVWLALLLFIAAAILFFATALVGRAFCGYFCFQTLWTDFFIWVEARIQGERPARVRLYRQPWTREKVLKVGATHLVWLLASFWTGMGFILYFGYAPELVARFFTGQAAVVAYATVAVLTLTTYFAAGYMREQICTYVCPYGRFQSVMYDPETLAVHYDARRGEGRLGRASARSGLRTLEERHDKGSGDCIDCKLCVQVCPTGIDIREGLQYKCISCGLCIDACNGIMDSMGFPRGLIRYDSEANLAKAEPVKPHLHWKRLKVVGYGVSIVFMAAYLAYSIGARSSFEGAVTQVRQPLFVVLSNGDIRNRYQIRVTNKLASAETFTVAIKGLPASVLDLGNLREVTVKPGHSAVMQASVILDPATAVRTREVTFVITPRLHPGEARIETAGFHYTPRG
ncbi:cytochrome c oxidase accessory protein CcoG [Betaproteobacteria bacterium SCN2]|jgi:cytochrome c oxidase accessory protein FixG|nr:cytochrome c oxidase accessory protein CcoG [Betaproteobacteria bacterium SCN2]